MSEIPPNYELSCVVWSNPNRISNPKARLYHALTTKDTPPKVLCFKTSRLNRKKRYRMAHFVQSSAPDDKIVHLLSISSAQEPVIIPITLAERCLGWTDFEYVELDREVF